MKNWSGDYSTKLSFTANNQNRVLRIGAVEEENSLELSGRPGDNPSHLKQIFN